MTLSGFLYECVAGDTFDLVALSVYGNEKYACELLNANPEHCNKLVFSGGEKLYLPVVEVEPRNSTEPYMSTTAPWKE